MTATSTLLLIRVLNYKSHFDLSEIADDQYEIEFFEQKIQFIVNKCGEMRKTVQTKKNTHFFHFHMLIYSDLIPISI